MCYLNTFRHECIIITLMREKLIFLRSLKIFSHLSDGELLQIADLCKAWRFDEEAVIAWQKEIADKLYIVRQGILNSYQVDFDGNEKIRRTHVMGDYFDELWLFGENVHDATIRAATNGSLYILDQGRFKKFVEQNPQAELDMVDQAWKELDQYLIVQKKHANVSYEKTITVNAEPTRYSRRKPRELRVNRRWLDEALQESFAHFDLQKMLVYELDVPLSEIDEQGSVAKVVFHMIDYFHKRNQLEKLIAVAYKERPNNTKLRELAEKHPYHRE